MIVFTIYMIKEEERGRINCIQMMENKRGNEFPTNVSNEISIERSLFFVANIVK